MGSNQSIGEQCREDDNCKSKNCVSNRCRQGNKSDGNRCSEDDECSRGKCRDWGNNDKRCCPSGGNTRWDQCGNIPAGGNCKNHDGSQCKSGKCHNWKCVTSDSTCRSGYTELESNTVTRAPNCSHKGQRKKVYNQTAGGCERMGSTKTVYEDIEKTSCPPNHHCSHGNCRHNPVNCEVSEWGNWTACNSTCETTGQQTRTRRIIVNRAHGGNGCPSLTENRGCDKKPYNSNTQYCHNKLIKNKKGSFESCSGSHECLGQRECGKTRTGAHTEKLECSPDIPFPLHFDKNKSVSSEGGWCWEKENCIGHTSGTNCENGRCERPCTNEEYRNETTRKCDKRKTSGKECVKREECLGQRECGKTRTGDKTEKLECSPDIPFPLHFGKNKSVGGEGAWCWDNENCIGHTNGTSCIQGRCRRPCTDKEYKDSSGVCKPKKNTSEVCVKSEECLGQRECGKTRTGETTEKLQCSPDIPFPLHFDKNKSIGGEGDWCWDRENCIGHTSGTSCIQGRCRKPCKDEEYRDSNGICKNKKNTGDVCVESEECLGQRECGKTRTGTDSEKLECSPDIPFPLHFGKNKSISGEGEWCWDKENCRGHTSGTSCIQGKCRKPCKKGEYIGAIKCETLKTKGESCKEHRECNTKYCKNEKCSDEFPTVEVSTDPLEEVDSTFESNSGMFDEDRFVFIKDSGTGKFFAADNVQEDSRVNWKSDKSTLWWVQNVGDKVYIRLASNPLLYVKAEESAMSQRNLKLFPYDDGNNMTADWSFEKVSKKLKLSSDNRYLGVQEDNGRTVDSNSDNKTIASIYDPVKWNAESCCLDHRLGCNTKFSDSNSDECRNFWKNHCKDDLDKKGCMEYARNEVSKYRTGMDDYIKSYCSKNPKKDECKCIIANQTNEDGKFTNEKIQDFFEDQGTDPICWYENCLSAKNPLMTGQMKQKDDNCPNVQNCIMKDIVFDNKAEVNIVQDCSSPTERTPEPEPEPNSVPKRTLDGLFEGQGYNIAIALGLIVCVIALFMFYSNDYTDTQPYTQSYTQPYTQSYTQQYNQPYTQQYNQQYNQPYNQQYNQQYNQPSYTQYGKGVY